MSTQAPDVTFETLAEIDAVGDEWDELVDRVGGSPFTRPGWFAAWWNAFGEGRLEILTARAGDRLVGIVPLRRRGGIVESATNAYTPSFELVAEENVVAPLAGAIVARGGRGSVSFVDAGGAGARGLAAAAAEARLPFLVTTVQRSPYISIETDWDTFVASVGSKRNSDIRRRRRRLEEQGEVSVEIVSGGEHLRRALDEGFALEPSGWKLEERTAILSRPETVRFYTDLATWAADRGILRLLFLRVDGRPIAFEYGLEERGRGFILKGGHDPAFVRFAPSTLLLHARLEAAFSEGLESFEFLGDDEPWKRTWTSLVRERVQVQWFSASPLGRARRAALGTYLLQIRPRAKRTLGREARHPLLALRRRLERRRAGASASK